MICSNCGRNVAISLGQTDDQQLCVGCYVPEKLGSVKVTEIKDEKLYNALAGYAERTGNLVDHTDKGKAKQRKPRASSARG